MKNRDLPPHKRLNISNRTGGEGGTASLWTKEAQEYAAETIHSAIRMEQELERTWFECYMALEEHHRALVQREVSVTAFTHS
jgi:hypothetical protein